MVRRFSAIRIIRCQVLAACFFSIALATDPDPQCAAPGPHLVGWWQGEGNGNEFFGDNPGSLIGATFQPGEVGQGFSLDGAGYVEIPSSDALRRSSSVPSSVDAWVYPTSWPSSGVVPLGAIKPYYYGLLYLQLDHRIRAHVNDGAHWIYADAPFDLPLNAWTHVAQTWDGQELSIYVNGALIGSGATPGNAYPRIETPLFIGRWLVQEIDPQDFRFTGLVDEVGLYDASLAAADVAAIFQAGAKGRCFTPPTIVINFDDLPGMSYFTDTEVPSASMLSDHYLATSGVVFRSPDRPYVAVANLDSDRRQSQSPPNAIGGVTAGNTLDYAVAVTAEFFLPGDPTTKAVTDFVSVLVDAFGDGLPITLKAFDVSGSLLGTVIALDQDGPTLSISKAGIHSVELSGQFGSSFDDFTFHAVAAPVTPPSPFSVELVQTGRRCVSLMVSNDQAIKGGEVGIAYDPALVTPLSVQAGADFPGGGTLEAQLSAPNNCAPGSGVDAGLTVGWINPTSGSTSTPSGRHEIARICFAPAPDQPAGTCSPLSFVSCLGVAQAPVKNIVTGLSGSSIALAARDGQVCLQEELSFIRGDANGDGSFDISDAIVILGCLFIGDACPDCADARDVDDDGRVNVTDPIYLLNWRFLEGGKAPAAPFPACGRDPIADQLQDCESFLPCQ